MKLSKVEVVGLFGLFKHEVRIDHESGITIVIGENGLGKTVLLEMIEAFFKADYMRFNSIPFDKLIFEFTDNVVWKLAKSITPESLPVLELTEVIKKKTSGPIRLISYDPRELRNFAVHISRHISHLSRINPARYRDNLMGKYLSAEEVIQQYGNTYRDYVEGITVDDPRGSLPEYPDWFEKRRNEIKVLLIETQRLLSIGNNREGRHEMTVERNSEALMALTKRVLTESTELSSELDRTYPNRLVSRIEKSTQTIPDQIINDGLLLLEQKRKILGEVGLIEFGKDPLSAINNPQKVVKEVLGLYLEDSFAKLAIFDDLAKKIALYLDIINRRFKHKRLRVSRDYGMLIESTILVDEGPKPTRIPISGLSSGEQNELVLFYFLLFKAERNSLILIDEPEVSLHISWQAAFIEDLRDITKLNDLDVVIATHSPDIIGNNWDLKVELKGLE